MTGGGRGEGLEIFRKPWIIYNISADFENFLERYSGDLT